MNVRFHEFAEKELDEAFRYYEGDYPGRGYRFLEKVKEAIARVTLAPTVGKEILPGYRRIIVNRFPYKLIYSVEGGEVVIWVVAHGHRKPKYWQERIL